VEVRSVTGETTLSYALLEGSPESRRLVVLFPKLRHGGARPSFGYVRALEPLGAHLLTIGSDRDNFVGPRREMRGLRTAVSLVRATAGELGVPRENIATAGTSMGAVASLFVGLPAEVGHIVAGSPPVRMGRTVERLASLDGLREHTKRDAQRFLALGDNGEGPASAARWLNRLIPDLAAKVRAPMRIELVVSLSDRTYRANQRFAAELEDNPWIDCRLTLADYDGHRHVKDDFGDYARAVLSPVAGLKPASH
jgi:hypothetical protein